jgi:hypothetical protein
MSSLKAALIAALLGAVAVFAIVAGAFTATSNTEPAEAHCFDVTCLIELLTMDPCENNVESTFLGSDCCVGDVSTSFFGNQCCQTQIDPPSLVDAALLNGCCETQVNTAIFGSQCCEEVVTGETSAALFNSCCEPEENNDVNAAFFDPCEVCLEPSCIIEFLDSLNPDPCEVTQTALLNPCCESETPPLTGAAFFNLCCEPEFDGIAGAALFNPCCDQVDEVSTDVAFFNLGCDCDPPFQSESDAAFIGGSGDMLSQLFLKGILTLLGLEQPCEVQSLP